MDNVGSQIRRLQRLRLKKQYRMPFAFMIPFVVLYGGLALVSLEGCKKDKEFDEPEKDRPEGTQQNFVTKVNLRSKVP